MGWRSLSSSRWKSLLWSRVHVQSIWVFDVRRISEGFRASGTASGVFTKVNDPNNPITGAASNSPVAGFTFDGTHTHTFSASGTSGNEGSGSAIENRPPYYALCYIMKT